MYSFIILVGLFAYNNQMTNKENKKLDREENIAKKI